MSQYLTPHAESWVSELIHIVEWSVARMDDVVIADGLHDGEVIGPLLVGHVVGLGGGGIRGTGRLGIMGTGRLILRGRIMDLSP